MFALKNFFRKSEMHGILGEAAARHDLIHVGVIEGYYRLGYFVALGAMDSQENRNTKLI